MRVSEIFCFASNAPLRMPRQFKLSPYPNPNSGSQCENSPTIMAHGTDRIHAMPNTHKEGYAEALYCIHFDWSHHIEYC